MRYKLLTKEEAWENLFYRLTLWWFGEDDWHLFEFEKRINGKRYKHPVQISKSLPFEQQEQFAIENAKEMFELIKNEL